MLKYKIINYDTERMVFDVKVAQEEADFEYAKVLRLSLDSIEDVETLEKQIFQTFMNSLTTRERGTFSSIVEDHITSNLDQVMDITVPTIPGPVQSSVSDAVNDENNTSTNTVRII